MFRTNSEDKPTEEFCHHSYVSNTAIHLVLYQFSPRRHLSRWRFFTEPEPLAQRRANFKERSSLSGSSSEGFFPRKKSFVKSVYFHSSKWTKADGNTSWQDIYRFAWHEIPAKLCLVIQFPEFCTCKGSLSRFHTQSTYFSANLNSLWHSFLSSDFPKTLPVSSLWVLWGSISPSLPTPAAARISAH